MSDSQAYEEVTVTSDGIIVVKRFEEDEFPVPAIAFEFESERDEAVTVTLTDSVPNDIEVEDLGFHPEYGSEHWTIDDDSITFEREIEAGSSYTTVYGIRATGSDDVQQFLTEPTIESVDPPLSEDSSVTDDIIPETDEVVKDAISGDGEIPGLESDEESDEDVETLELNDPSESEAADSSDSDGNDTTTVTAEEESLTAAMASEIREQEISGEDLKLLRRAFDIAAEEGGSTEARIDQIQDDVADLRAYTGALEEFLDENGTGEELIREFEQELESFDDRLESLQSDIESNSTELDSVSDTVSNVDEEIESLGQEIEELEEKVTEGEVIERVEELEEKIDDLQSWQEQIKQTFGG